MINPGNVLGVA